jgi:hypothetical protein
LSDDYKAKNEVGEWLHLFNGLPFLSPDDATDAFTYDIIRVGIDGGEARELPGHWFGLSPPVASNL